MRTIAIINQKGGCGKTTSAINLAGVFARQDKRTLLVDMDPQAHCAAGLAIPEQRIDLHIGDAMLAHARGTIAAERHERERRNQPTEHQPMRAAFKAGGAGFGLRKG